MNSREALKYTHVVIVISTDPAAPLETCEMEYVSDILKYINSRCLDADYEELLPRYNVRNETALRMILHLLAEHLREGISFNGLYRLLQEIGLKVGVSTVVEYISILEKTRFIRSIECFSEQTTRTPKRHYWFVDNGLLSLFIHATQLREKLLRNTMAHAILQKYQKHTIYYASQRNASVDFYIPERDIAIMLYPNDELIPDAVQNLQRFDQNIL